MLIANLTEGAYIATVGYHDLGYQELGLDAEAQLRGRENLMQEALLRWRAGQVCRRSGSLGGGTDDDMPHCSLFPYRSRSSALADWWDVNQDERVLP